MQQSEFCNVLHRASFFIDLIECIEIDAPGICIKATGDQQYDQVIAFVVLTKILSERFERLKRKMADLLFLAVIELGQTVRRIDD